MQGGSVFLALIRAARNPTNLEPNTVSPEPGCDTSQRLDNNAALVRILRVCPLGFISLPPKASTPVNIGMSETQERFKVEELRYIAFACRCGLEITLDIASGGALNVQNPPNCPQCGHTLEQYCKAANAFKMFYDRAKEMAFTIVSKRT